MIQKRFLALLDCCLFVLEFLNLHNNHSVLNLLISDTSGLNFILKIMHIPWKKHYLSLYAISSIHCALEMLRAKHSFRITRPAIFLGDSVRMPANMMHSNLKATVEGFPKGWKLQPGSCSMLKYRNPNTLFSSFFFYKRNKNTRIGTNFYYLSGLSLASVTNRHLCTKLKKYMITPDRTQSRMQ